MKQVRRFHNRNKIRLFYNPLHSTWHIIHNLLKSAIEDGKGDTIARHLVGAKLQLRFPDLELFSQFKNMTNMLANSPGDFLIGQTAFHITVAPMPAVFEKCKHNISQGYRPFLLVPDSKLVGTRQNAELTCRQQISTESIESFVSQNINEISGFRKIELVERIKDLIKIYNRRVDEVETDKSLMIELPSNLT